MITLYHAPQSRSTRIIAFLEELGVPYDIRPVSIFRPMTGEGAPDPANPHPDKRVPAIAVDGQVVAESVAIILHLADRFPEAGLAPAPGDVRRGAYLTWLAWYAAEMEPVMFAAMTGEVAGSPAKQRQHTAVVERLETAFANAPYLLGDDYSAVDLLVASALGFARDAFPPSARMDAYTERCNTRPSVARARTLDDASGPQYA